MKKIPLHLDRRQSLCALSSEYPSFGGIITSLSGNVGGGPCFFFDGATAINVGPPSGFNITNGYTVLAWVKAGELTGTSNRVAWSFFADVNNRVYYQHPGNSVKDSSVYGKANGVEVSGTVINPVNDEWVWVAISHVGTTLTKRWGESNKGTDVVPDIATFVGTPDFLVGRYSGLYFLGKMAGIFLFEGAITDEQYTSVLVGNWPSALNLKWACPYPDPDGKVFDWTGNNGEATVTDPNGTIYSASGGPVLPASWKNERVT